jgi:hypothetical protein
VRRCMTHETKNGTTKYTKHTKHTKKLPELMR